MKQERRSRWYEWTCDLDGCVSSAMTHPAVDEDPDAIPPNWIVVPPPRFWRGPALAFCSRDHHTAWARGVMGPLLIGAGSDG